MGFSSSASEPGLCNIQREYMKTAEGGQRSSLPSEEKQISINLLLLKRRSKEGETVGVAFAFIYGHQTYLLVKYVS